MNSLQAESLRAAVRLPILGKMRGSLMLVHGELETIVRFSECFSLLISGGFVAMEPILRIFCPFWCAIGICAK